ncbi:MAG: hypothetical protein ACJ771_10850 [Chloroflexota bacterium]
MPNHRSHWRARAASAGVVVAIVALAVPSLVAAATTTVSAIPGGGWIQSPDNTGTLKAAIVVSPAAGPGVDSVKLATTTATTDAVGIARPLVAPLSNLTGGSWMTYATGDSSNLVSEPAALKFAIFRDGTGSFTSLVVERTYNATVNADVWQTTTFDGESIVWQTSNSDAFCNTFPFCTLAEFKEHYPDANIAGLTVGIGSGIPVTTSFVDAVTVAIGEGSDTWNFELAAAPATPAPPGATAPPTDFAATATDPDRFDARPFILFGIVSLIALMSISMRRSRQTH